MKLERAVTWLGALIAWLCVVILAYGALGIVLTVTDAPHAGIWQETVPIWLLIGTLAVIVVHTVLVVAYRRQKRDRAARLEREAEDWPQTGAAQAARVGAVPLLEVSAFRAHARGAHTVELTWNPPMDEVDEVLVLRSMSAFATSPEATGDQIVLYLGDETRSVDVELEDQRMYYYAAFARAGGVWSAPVWAHALTPPLPLLRTMLGTLKISIVLMYPLKEQNRP